MRTIFLVLILVFSSAAFSDTPESGAMRTAESGETEIFNGWSGQWSSVESFWLDYANSKGGLTWGRNDRYPEYARVHEFDTLLIETAHGNCLMEFFHKRWRRANDVRRWNKQLNNYDGCAGVFKD